jgi:hypothetical protein
MRKISEFVIKPRMQCSIRRQINCSGGNVQDY